MPLPRLSDDQIEWVIREVAGYIEKQRQTYRQAATALNKNQITSMRPFFPMNVLDSARVVVLAHKRVGNPAFYGDLVRMGFDAALLPNFDLMAAITFVDTVVSHERFSDRLLFHELVHVVQYAKLGLEQFAARYVRGFLQGGSYEAIPLEKNAYELDAWFAAAPARPFSVADSVQAWIDQGRF